MHTRKTVQAAIAAVLSLIICASGSMVRAEPLANKGDSLVGSWFLDVTPDGPVPAPFKMLMTFTSDGTLTETQNDALAPPFFLTPGHGVWGKVGKRRYALKMVQLAFDSAGGYTGKLTLNATITEGEQDDKISMVMQVKVQDADGNLIFSTGGVAQGTRIRLDESDSAV